MEIQKPQKEEITIYSKSGCVNCINVKKMLKEKNIRFSVIDCDEFILEDKEGFLQFIQNMIGKEYKIFPMVFDYKTFIGGFKETCEYIKSSQDKILEFDLAF